jgi:hypothetical protein
MKATVIVNPIAGPGRSRTIGACVDLAKSVFTRHHYDVDVRVTTGPHDANRFAKEAVANHVDVVTPVDPATAWLGISPFPSTRRRHLKLRPPARSAPLTLVICTARCSSTSPASGLTRALPAGWPPKAIAAG